MAATGTRTAVTRIVAWALDWLVISAYAGALVPLGVFLLDRGFRLPPAGWNALAFGLLVLPTTVWLAAWERGVRGATPGKRLLGLRTAGFDGRRLGGRRALARNALKVALPWELGHTAALPTTGVTETRVRPTALVRTGFPSSG
jgi:uncharacterized RDD family membrane protein YckC